MHSLLAFTTACTIGAFALIGVATVGVAIYVYSQEKPHKTSGRKTVLQLQRELEETRVELKALQERRNKERLAQLEKKKEGLRKRRNRASEPVFSDDFRSCQSVIDECGSVHVGSDDEGGSLAGSVGGTARLEAILIDVDKTLNDPINIEEVESALETLEDLCLEYPSNVDLLYRIGQAHHKVADQSEDNCFIHKRLDKGIQACKSALKADPEHGDVHKWYAALLGTKSHNSSDPKEQISYGFSFKQHIDKALSIKPNDYHLHFMLGMFQFAIAGITWLQRKMAAALFADPPNATYAEANSSFLKVEKMAPFAWKENKLMIGKCKIAMSQYKDGVKWLKMALDGRSTSLGKKTDAEIKQLLQKYDSSS